MDIHLLVLLINRRQAREHSLLDEAISEDHEKTADDREIAEEKIEIEDEAVTEGLDDDDREEAGNRVLLVAAHDHKSRADGHGDNVEDQEEVCQAPRNYSDEHQCFVASFCHYARALTMSEVPQVCELIAPLCKDP